MNEQAKNLHAAAIDFPFYPQLQVGRGRVVRWNQRGGSQQRGLRQQRVNRFLNHFLFNANSTFGTFAIDARSDEP